MSSHEDKPRLELVKKELEAAEKAAAEEAAKNGESNPPETEEEKKERINQTTQLIDIGKTAELFHTPTRTPYAAIDRDGHREYMATHSTEFKDFMVLHFYNKYGGVPNSQAVRDAIGLLSAMARFEGETHDVFLRIGGTDQEIWLDLADDDWRAVRIDASGWEVVAKPAVRFRRADNMLPLPTPVRGGMVSELRKFVNPADEQSWILLLSCLVMAYRPRGPYPICYGFGEQGTAKSTTYKFIRDCVDPSKGAVNACPREERDLFICANASRVLAFDNVSKLDDWLSDALCRIATGAGFRTRTLYTTAEETVLSACLPIFLSGISVAAARGDFLERSVMVEFARIPEERRRDEATLQQEFAAAQPRILGGLLDVVSATIKNLPTTHLDKKPRMADYAIWATAAESAMGLRRGAFMAAYRANTQRGHDIALESSAIAPFVQELMRNCEWWSDKAGALLVELNKLQAGNTAVAPRKPRDWPGNPRKLAAEMKKLGPALRSIGIEYTTKYPAGHHGCDHTLARVRGNTSPKSQTPQRSTESTSSGGSIGETRHPTPHGDVPASQGDDIPTSPTTSHPQATENAGQGGIGDVGDVVPSTPDSGEPEHDEYHLHVTQERFDMREPGDDDEPPEEEPKQ